MRFRCSKIGYFITRVVHLCFLMDFVKCNFNNIQQQTTIKPPAAAVMSMAGATATTTAATATYFKDSETPVLRMYLRLGDPKRDVLSNTKNLLKKRLAMWTSMTHTSPTTSPLSLSSHPTAFVSSSGASVKYESRTTAVSTYPTCRTSVLSAAAAAAAAATATLIGSTAFPDAPTPLGTHHNRDDGSAFSDDHARLFDDSNQIDTDATNDYENTMDIIKTVANDKTRAYSTIVTKTAAETATPTSTTTLTAAATTRQNSNQIMLKQFLNDYSFLNLDLNNTSASSLVLSGNGASSTSSKNNTNNNDDDDDSLGNSGKRNISSSNSDSSSSGSRSRLGHTNNNSNASKYNNINNNHSHTYYTKSIKNSGRNETILSMNSQKVALNSPTSATGTASAAISDSTAVAQAEEAATVFASLRVTNDKGNRSSNNNNRYLNRPLGESVQSKLSQSKLEKTDAPMLNYIFDTFSSAKKHHHHDQRHGPHFEDVQRVGQPTNITVQAGGSVLLNCRISLLQDKTVSWVRRNPEGEDGLDLLTVGPHTYTGDKRYTMEFQYPNNWRLKISNVRKSDEAMYECQISTHPPRVIQINLLVNAPKVMIVDEFGDPLQEKYYEIDSTLQLSCIVRYVAMTSAVVFWRHGTEQVLNYDITRGGVSVKTDLMDDGANSTLFIAKINKSDSGNYTCSISGTQGYTIMVHILNGESFAELHHGMAAFNATSYVTLIMISVIKFIFMRINLGKS